MKILFIIISSILFSQGAMAQRITNYDLDVDINLSEKTVRVNGTITIDWEIA